MPARRLLHHARRVAASLVIFLATGRTEATAQFTIMAESSGLNVSTAPTIEPNREPNTGPFSVPFTVKNIGTKTLAAISLTCVRTGPITCGTVTPSYRSSLAPGAKFNVTVTYTTGSAGSGTIGMRADTDLGATAYKERSVLVTGVEQPQISLTPYNGHTRDYSKCVASCFDMMTTIGSPGYNSMNSPRNVTLVYNSSTARPTPVIQVDVTPGFGSPVTYRVELRRSTTNTLLTLSNGQTAVYYLAQSGTTRVAAGFDARANGLAPGVHDISITVTAIAGSGASNAATTPSRLLVVDRSQSVFGAGWGPTGVQQIIPRSGGSVMVVEGDGSAFFYDCQGCGSTYAIPPGTSATLTRNTTEGWYRRTYLDGSYVQLNYATGKMERSVDRFGNATNLTWNGEQLTRVTDPIGREINLFYTPAGYIERVQDGQTTWFNVNAAGHLQSVQLPDNLSWSYTFEYDTLQRLTSLTDRSGQVTNVGYDELNRITSLQAPLMPLFDGTTGRPTTSFEPAERVVWQPGLAGTSSIPKVAISPDTVRATVSDPLGATTRFALNSFGSATQIIDPLGQTTAIDRDTHSRPALVTAPNGHRSRTTYTGYLVTRQENLTTGRTTDYTYNSLNDVIEIVDASGRTQFSYLTPTVIREYLPNASEIWHYSDGRGRDTSVTDGGEHITRYIYDPMSGNLKRTVNAEGHSDSVHFDALGRVDTLYATDGAKTVLTLGALGQILAARNPLGYTTAYEYDHEMRPLRIQLPGGQVYKFEYNSLGLLTARYDLADTTKAERYDYDLAGRLRTLTTRDNQEVNLSYDPVGRLLTRSGTGVADATFRYGAAGEWLVGTNVYAYDSLVFDQAGRLARSHQRLNGTTFESVYTHDIQDRITSRVLTGSGYTAERRLHYWPTSPTGQPDSLCITGLCEDLTITSEYLPASRQIIYNGTDTWYSTHIQSSLHGSAQQMFSGVPGLNAAFGINIQHDTRGRVSSIAPHYGSTAPIQVFQYDSAGQLTNACLLYSNCDSGPAYSYDASGNLQITGVTMMMGSGNRLLRHGCKVYLYDVSGNRTTAQPPIGCQGDFWTYSWDALNQLQEVRENTQLKASFHYDAFGRRVAKTTPAGTERYVYDGDQVVLDLDGNNAVATEYAWRPGTDRLFAIKKGSWIGVAVTNPANGTVRGVVSPSGSTIYKSYGDRAWGNMTADTGVVIRYRAAGREFDAETGLYYMRSRYYDPRIGRFISEDPNGIAGGLNLYTYAANDPVSRRDPTGTSPECGDEGFDSSGRDRFGERPATNGTGLPDLVATTPCPQAFDPIGTPWDLDPPGRTNAIDFVANNASVGGSTAAQAPFASCAADVFGDNFLITNSYLYGFEHPVSAARAVGALGAGAAAAGLTQSTGVLGLRGIQAGGVRTVGALAGGRIFIGRQAIGVALGVSAAASLAVNGALQLGIAFGSAGTALGTCWR